MNNKKIDSKGLEIIKGGMPAWWLNDASAVISQTTGCTKCTFKFDQLENVSNFCASAIDIPPTPAACDNLS